MTGQVLAILGTLLLLALVTWGETGLHHIAGVNRPYTIFYLIPVAIGAALLGVRGGIAAALISVVLARAYLFSGHQAGTSLLLSFPRAADSIEFGALLAGTLTVALVTGRLRTALGELNASSKRLSAANYRLADTNTRLENANNRLLETEQERRVFHRDVLMAVTGGKLRLVEPDEMPPPDLAVGPPQMSIALAEPGDATSLRRTLRRMGEEMGMEDGQLSDLCTGVTEAATNAIKHGHGGQANVWTTQDAIIVQVADHGQGIAPALLARATLEQGYSTRPSLGMGFFLMLNSSDTLVLATSDHGTSILLRVSVSPHKTEQETLLARYIGI